MIRAQGKSDGRTGTKILLEAMSKDQVHLARFVLDALDGEIVDSRTEGAHTPLISSVLLPDGPARCRFAELLLQRGASVNCQDQHGRTALSHACERGHLDAVKILVRNNADPEVADAWGNTALMYAAAAGRCAVVEFLVRAFKRLGLQIHRHNRAGNSAVGVAEFLGHADCIRALTNGSKRGREAEGGRAGPGRAGPGRADAGDRFERRVAHLAHKLELLHTCKDAESLPSQNCSRQTRPRTKQVRLPSMDSIEEFERENEGPTSPPQELVFSRVLTPKPPPRTPDQSAYSTRPKSTSDDHLPPLLHSCEPRKSTLSHRPGRNSPKPGAPCALDILLTPLLANKTENEPAVEKSKVLDSVRRFHDSYYQKRWSLPTSVLSPSPPERALVPARKSRTGRRREASPCRAEPPQFAAAASTTTFSVLSNKLLRRLTSPEFKKDVREFGEDPAVTSRRMPRSETFPQGAKHPQVGSKPSIDSISSVKCEFDFHSRVLNS